MLTLRTYMVQDADLSYIEFRWSLKTFLFGQYSCAV